MAKKMESMNYKIKFIFNEEGIDKKEFTLKKCYQIISQFC